MNTVITDEIFEEVKRAMTKFPTWPTDPIHALAVVGEEYGELTKEVLQMTYEPHKTSYDEVRKEAVQTAAMALRFALSLGCYDFAAGPQHSQGEPPMQWDRIKELEDLLTSARTIAQRNGEGTAWERFDERLAKAGIGSITAKVFKVLPSDG
jgi:NTP pyrophosphatase (non-canonical NTP hydrolase)